MRGEKDSKTMLKIKLNQKILINIGNEICKK